MAALAAGAAIVAGLAIFATPDIAAALGGAQNRSAELATAGHASSVTITPVWPAYGSGGSARSLGGFAQSFDGSAPRRQSHRHSQESSVGAASRRPVCVRLCDGYFFPLDGAAGDPAGREAACAGLCPDAPTDVYFQAAGADRIEDAVSASGARYSALPVALRYRSADDSTCTCRRAGRRPIAAALDATLRRGDAVMSANGFRVFRGGARAPYAARDFVALAASPIGADWRARLSAMERVSLVRPPAIVVEARASFDRDVPAAAAHGDNAIRWLERKTALAN